MNKNLVTRPYGSKYGLATSKTEIAQANICKNRTKPAWQQPRLKTTLLLALFLSLAIASRLGATPRATPAKDPQTPIVELEQVYSYEKMVQDIDVLIGIYPNIEKKVLGKSRLGKDILAVKLGTGDSNIIIHAAHHAREWATTNITMKILEDYAQRSPDILNQVAIWFVPMVNPDGVTLQQKGLNAIPKVLHNSLIDINEGSTNFRRWKANLAGVDLNQQYPAYRREKKKTYSYADFSGKYPLMEPESLALYLFTQETKPEIAVSYHSSGEVIFHPTYMKDNCIAKKISQLTGYTIYPLPPESLGGGYTDWFVQEFNKPAITIEIGKYAGDTNVPIQEISSIWKKNKEVGLYVAEEAARRINNTAPDQRK